MVSVTPFSAEIPYSVTLTVTPKPIFLWDYMNTTRTQNPLFTGISYHFGTISDFLKSNFDGERATKTKKYWDKMGRNGTI